MCRRKAWKAEERTAHWLDKLVRDSETQCSNSLWQPLAAWRARKVIDIEIEIEIELGAGREACRSHANQGEGDETFLFWEAFIIPHSQLLVIHNLLPCTGLSSFSSSKAVELGLRVIESNLLHNGSA